MDDDLKRPATPGLQSLQSLHNAYEQGLLDQLGPFASRRFARYRLIAMGQSLVACRAAASRMRSLRLDAGAELASSRYGYPMDPDTLVIAVSASGATPEVTQRLDRLDGHFPVVAVTDDVNSPVAQRAGAILPIHASGPQNPLPANAFAHTAMVLHSLAVVFSGGITRMVARDQMALIERVGAAWSSLEDSFGDWGAQARDKSSAPCSLLCLAPAERIGSAEHSAYLVNRRSGPRAWAIESSDLAYQGWSAAAQPTTALLYTGGQADQAAAKLLAANGSSVIAVGAGAPSVQQVMPRGSEPIVVRYSGEDNDKVATFAEHRVAALLA